MTASENASGHGGRHAPAWPDRLSAYLDGELSPADRDAVDAHMRDCAECRALLADLRRVVGWLGSDVPSAPAPAVLRNVMAHVEATSVAPIRADVRRAGRRVTRSRVGAFAAAASIFVAASVAVWNGSRTDDRTSPAQPPSVAVGSPNPPAAAGRGRAEPTVAPPQGARPAAAPDAQAQESDRLQATLARDDGGLTAAARQDLARALATLDAALADAERSLRDDPRSPALLAYVQSVRAHKLETLRAMATHVGARS